MNNNLLTEKDILELIEIKAENKNLDYKAHFNWDKATKKEKAEIIKDILGMSNTQDGGRIIFGIEDSNYDFVGLAEEEFKSFDITKINDFLHEYSDPRFSCQVYKKIINKKYIVVIDVPEYQEIPIICKKHMDSLKNKGKKILQAGHIYIRTEKGSTETIKTSDEMREFLGRAIVKKGDELLHNIDLLIKGRPSKFNKESILEDQSKSKYKQEIENANNFFNEKIGKTLKKYGYWEMFSYPVKYETKRVPDLINLKNSISNFQVSLRGWYFPHIQKNKNHGNNSTFNNGFQSHVNWEQHIEGFRIYQSGLFVLKRALWEDINKERMNNKRFLEFRGAIWTITEFFLFCKRIYNQIASDDENLYIKIIINECNNRQLHSSKFGVHLDDEYICMQNEPILIEDIFRIIDLKVSYKEIAAKIIKQIFHIFNWDTVTGSLIDSWQTNLIER